MGQRKMTLKKKNIHICRGMTARIEGTGSNDNAEIMK